MLRRARTTTFVVNNEKFLWLRGKKQDSKMRNKRCRGRGQKVEEQKMKKNKAKYLHSIQLSNVTRCETLESFDNFALRSEFSFEFLTFRCRIIWKLSQHTHIHMCVFKSVGATKTSLLLASFSCRGKRQRKHCVYAACDRRCSQFELATSDSGSYLLQNIRSGISAPSIWD